jgi:hypothetical protein
MAFSKHTIDSGNIPSRYLALLAEFGFNCEFSAEKTIRKELAPLAQINR